jgi:hypothetical protein
VKAASWRGRGVEDQGTWGPNDGRLIKRETKGNGQAVDDEILGRAEQDGQGGAEDGRQRPWLPRRSSFLIRHGSTSRSTFARLPSAIARRWPRPPRLALVRDKTVGLPCCDLDRAHSLPGCESVGTHPCDGITLLGSGPSELIQSTGPFRQIVYAGMCVEATVPDRIHGLFTFREISPFGRLTKWRAGSVTDRRIAERERPEHSGRSRSRLAVSVRGS